MFYLHPIFLIISEMTLYRCLFKSECEQGAHVALVVMSLVSFNVEYSLQIPFLLFLPFLLLLLHTIYLLKKQTKCFLVCRHHCPVISFNIILYPLCFLGMDISSRGFMGFKFNCQAHLSRILPRWRCVLPVTSPQEEQASLTTFNVVKIDQCIVGDVS